MIRERDTIKWGSTFFITEHEKMLKHLSNDDYKQPRPQVDEQEMEEIKIRAYESLYNSCPMKITIRDYGYLYDISGIVREVNVVEEKIMVITDLEEKYLDMNKITRVKRILK